MNADALREILKLVQAGKISPETALRKMKTFPYQNLGFARLDTHRGLRKGFPETIFCEGKSTEDIVKIIGKLVEDKTDILATRASQDVARAVQERYPQARYFDKARAIVIQEKDKKKSGRKKISRTGREVLIITAGTSDIPVAEEAAVTAEFMGSKVKKIYDVGVAGIHRLMDESSEILKAKVIVVVAGMEGALASVVGGIAACPVIAVPTSIGYGASFGGVAPLLTMLNSCAPGVAVVNIDNGYGAGYLASIIVRDH